MKKYWINTSYIFALFLVFCAVLTIASGQTTAREYVINGGFERSSSDGGLQGWSPNGAPGLKGSYVWVKDSSSAHSGDCCVRLTSEGNSEMAVMTPAFEIKPGEYELEMAVKGTGKFTVYLYTYDDEKGFIGSVPFGGQASSEWQELKWAYTAEQNVKQIAFAIHTAGNIYIDDCSFRNVQTGEESSCAAQNQTDLTGVSHFWTLPKIKNPPIIDGRFSVEEWSKASAITGFTGADKMIASRAQPVVCGAYDDECLYIVFVSPVLKGSTVVATLNGPDSPVWNDDDVEILLQPSPSEGVVVHLLGGPAGGYYDEKDGRKFDSQMVYRSTLMENEWVAEFSIPFKAFGVAKPADGDIWGANFCRGYVAPHLSSAWSPAINFLDVATFGRIRFGGDGASARIVSLGNIFAGDLNINGEILAEKGAFTFGVAADVRAVKPKEISVVNVHESGEAEALKLETRQIVLSDGRGAVSYQKQLEMKPSRLVWEVFDVQNNTLIQRHSINFDTYPPIEVVVHCSPAKGIVEVLLDVAGSYITGRQLEGTVGLYNQKDGSLLISKKAVFDQEKGKAVFELKDIPVGDYTFEASVITGKNKTVKNSAKFSQAGQIPEIYSEIGYVPEVPEPWTPVVIEGNNVDVWNRSVAFGGNGLPESIKSAGMTVLAGPIVMRAFADGKELPAMIGSHQVKKLSQGSAEAVGSVSFPGLSVSTRSLTEFDGCIRVELEINPGMAQGPNSLILEIPLSKKFAELIHSHVMSWGNTNSGSIPDGDGVVWSKNFNPVIWLGNTNAGLCWFAASQKGWMVGSSDITQEIVRTENEILLRVHLADKPFPAGKVRQIVFGLQATPVKSIRADWRLKERYIRHPMAPPELLINSVLFEAEGKWWGWPEPKSDEQVKTMLEDVEATKFLTRQGREAKYWSTLKKARDEVHADGGRMYWYAILQELGTASPWYSTYGEEWNLTYGIGYECSEVEWLNAKGVCPASKWQDLYIGTIATSSLPAYDFDGVYLDLFLPWKCANAAHGCGYIDDNGVRQGEYTIWPMRDQMKRLYRVVHARKDGAIIGHLSANFIPAIHGFVDSALNGEQYWTYFNGQGGVDYHDILTLDKCRTEVLARQWGWAPLFLPEFKTTARQTSREMLSLILLHDSLVVPAFMDASEAHLSNAILWKLGFVEAEFIGYFDSPQPATADSPDVYVSAYKNAGGKTGSAILIVTNHGLKDGTFNIVPNTDALGLTSAKWTAAECIDKETQKTLVSRDNAFEISLPGKDFKIVSIGSD
ncbi:MAG: glycoside hydrolase domain-containing protein [Sedimentisphaerales bacterium]